MRISKSDRTIIFSAVGIFSCALVLVVFLVSKMAVASEDLSKNTPTLEELKAQVASQKN